MVQTGQDNPQNSGTLKVQDIAVLALERIEAEGLPPTPQIYELWFRFFQGDPEVVRAIDRYEGRLDEVTCHKIYKRYLSESARDDAVRKISEQVQQAVTEIAMMLSTAKNASTEYNETLEDSADKINNAESLEDLGRIVSTIVEDTKRMVQKNQELELQLVSSSSQVAELRKNLDSVKKEAQTDGLTGLANRKAFDRQIRNCIEDADETEKPLVLMMLDIDHFKEFNDSHGHQVGDQVLRLVARTLTDGVKGRDFAARYGGEEFSIILTDTTLESGVKVAEALRKMVENKEVVNKTNNQNLGRITLSIGLAMYKQGETVSDFIERADKALYAAKQAGRNRVHASPS